jgi:hypothetical protein
MVQEYPLDDKYEKLNSDIDSWLEQQSKQRMNESSKGSRRTSDPIRKPESSHQNLR